MSEVYVLCGEGYEETIIFGVFNDEVCLRDAYYEVEKYNIENISYKIYKFNLNQIEGSYDHEFNMFFEQAEEVNISC